MPINSTQVQDAAIAAIVRRRLSGEKVTELAKEFGVSERQMSYAINAALAKGLTLTLSGKPTQSTRNAGLSEKAIHELKCRDIYTVGWLAHKVDECLDEGDTDFDDLALGEGPFDIWQKEIKGLVDILVAKIDDIDFRDEWLNKYDYFDSDICDEAECRIHVEWSPELRRFLTQDEVDKK